MRKKKFWVGFAIVLLMLAGLYVYTNNQINELIDNIAQSGLVEFEGISNAVTGGGKNNPGTKTNGTTAQDTANQASTATSTAGTSQDSSSPVNYDPSGQPVLTPEQNRMATGVQSYLGRTVDRRDLLAAGNIVISRFSWGEINYLYSVGSRPHGNADLEKVRALCLSRLGGGDIATLRGLAGKYGLSLKILDPSVPIR